MSDDLDRDGVLRDTLKFLRAYSVRFRWTERHEYRDIVERLEMALDKDDCE